MQALNGEILDGQLACYLTSGQPITVDTPYDILNDFYNCSTTNGGFSVAALATTTGLSTLYFYYGSNSPCSVLYGPLSSPATQETVLQGDSLSVGGAVYVRLGDPGCEVSTGSSSPCAIMPPFSDGMCNSEIGDNAEVILALLDFSITDEDGLSNTVFSYEIISGNELGHFSINPSSGRLSLVSSIDRDEGLTVFALEVLVDDGQFNTTLMAIVEILDENDNNPVPDMATFTRTISEELPIDTFVLTAIFTDEDDGPNAILRYSIDPPSPDFALLDDSVANITTSRVFDYEDGDTFFSFVINAQDTSSFPQVGSARVEVTISDANDNRPSLEVTLRGGGEYVEDFEPVRPASVVLVDQDSSVHPLLYAIVTIETPLDGVVETLDIPLSSLPSGFKYLYSNFTLLIVGAGSPALYTSVLNNVTYENVAIQFELPLTRNISYAVCDGFLDESVQSLLSEDTQRAFSTAATATDLPDADAQLLLDGCLELVSDEIVVPLVETNDRPQVLGPTQFPPISEDITEAENLGMFVMDVFGDVITDTDRDSVLGIAVIGHGSPAVAESAEVESNADCLAVYDSISSMGMGGCQGRQLDSDDFCACPPFGRLTCQASPSEIVFSCIGLMNARFCTCPLPQQSQIDSSLPEFSGIQTLELDLGVGENINLSPILVPGTSLDHTFATSEQLTGFASSSSLLISTLSVDGSVVTSPSGSFRIDYEPIGDVTEDSALVLGPYSLVRWVPIENSNGIAYLTFKAWDTTNGVLAGSRGINTLLETDTSFSLESDNATVSVVAENDPPVIRLGGSEETNYSTSYTEGGNSVFVSNRSAVVLEFDSNDLFLSNLTVSISGIDGSCDLPDFVGVSEDQLSYLNTTMVPLDEVTIDITGQACTTYSFLGSMSVDNWRSFITMIRFSVGNPEPSEHTRQLAFVISDALSTSAPAYTTITVDLVSDICPAISLASSGPVNYTEHSSPAVIGPLLTVTDEDRNPEIGSASVQIISTPNDPCTTCELNVSSTSLPSGVSVTGTATTLTITGMASPAEYQALLRTVSFQDTGDEPSFDLVMVRFTLRDPTLTSCQESMADIGVMILHINDNSPMIYLNYPNSEDFSATFTEGAGTVGITGMVRIIDNDGLDSDLYTVVVAIEEGCVPSEDRLEFPNALGSTLLSEYNETTCSLEIEASGPVLQGDLSELVYLNLDIENPTSGERTIIFTVTDEMLDPMSAQTTLTVQPVNDQPRVDLDQTNLVSSDTMIVIDDTSGLITGPSGSGGAGAVLDPDDNMLVSMTLVLTEVNSLGDEVTRSDQAFESLVLTSSVTFEEFGVSGTFIPESGQLLITGASSLESYTTILNNILYSNRRVPLSDENRRRVAVSVSDGDLTSAQAFSFLTLNFNPNPPMLDLNGEEAGTNVDATYIITESPLSLFPTAFLMDIDGDRICSINVTLIGLSSTCLPNSIEFSNAYSIIDVDTTTISNGINYRLSINSLSECLEAIVFQDVLRGVRFSVPSTALPGSCTLQVVATEDRGLNSNVAAAIVEVIAFNAPPFIDLDLGLSGRDYSTIYFQGGRTQHIVSIFDAARANNITDMTVVGEAMDMAAEAPTVLTSDTDTPAFDDGTVFHGVVVLEESYAGYVLRDVDSPTLSYLQVEFFAGANLELDVISFPCGPTPAAESCTSTPLSFLTPQCNNSVFDACSANVTSLCSDLQVTIFCSSVGRKAYRFEYLSNGLTTRYSTLLEFLGYDFLSDSGGSINEIRLLNISVFDPLSGAGNPLAVTRIRIQNQDVLLIILNPPSFVVYENERPLRTCNLYTVTVQRLDGTVPASSEVIYNITQGNVGDAFGIREDGVIFLNRAVDREVLSIYNLVITARIRTADPDATASASLTGNVIDVNDNHPIAADSYTVNVTEGTVGATVVHVIATDADEGLNAELSYLLLGIGAEMFQVDDTGLVTTRVALNRTIEDYYLLVMIIMDRGEIYLSTHSVINVMVVTPPPTNLEFIPALQDYSIREDVRVGTALNPALIAVEIGGSGDTSNIRYRFLEITSLATGNREFPSPFIVDAMTGIMTVNNNLDSERTSHYFVTVETYSIAPLFAAASGFANFTIIVLDVNELPPMFTDAPYSLQVAENTPIGSTLTRFVATDDDSMNLGLVYSLAADAPSTLPFLVEADGDLIVNGDLDYEDTITYSFSIVVNDRPGANMLPMQATAMVTVTIADRNDNPPVFVNTPYVRTVSETANDGFVVLSFSSSDSDSLVNTMVEYSIEGLEMTPFCFSDSSMTIEVCNSSLLTSIEEDIVFTAVLVADNPPGPDSTQTQTTRESVSITLVLVNEFDPQVSMDVNNHPGYLEEHCGRRGEGSDCINVLVFDFSTISSDNDGGAGGILNYTLLTLDVPFSLDETSGELRVNRRIDREMQDQYSLLVMVSDNGDSADALRTTQVTLNIPIFDIDDNPPAIVEPFEFNVTEDMTATLQVFGTVLVEDLDINGTRRFEVISTVDPPRSSGCLTQFSLTNPNYLPIFLNSETGELNFCMPVDFEVGPTVFVFDVEVTDRGDIDIGEVIHHFDRRPITVNVLDSNDNTPVFPPGQNTDFSIPENSPPATSVGSVEAEDIDAGINGMLEFSVVNGSSSPQCTDDVEVPFYASQTSESTADILQCRELDFEEQQIYIFMVQASDLALNPSSGAIQVSVTLLDRNDNPPIFDSDNYTMNVQETDSSLQMSPVLRVSVSDLDSPPNSVSTFDIISPQPSPFGLRSGNSSSVELFVASPAMIDFEDDPMRYEVTIQATNAAQDDETHTATTIVTVIITDVNDNGPMIMMDTLMVRENQPEGSAVGQVRAVDIDTGAGGQLDYFIDDCNFPDVPFMINMSTGDVTLCQPLDYEVTRSYTIPVMVCDRVIPPICSNGTFIVNVVDLNDNQPIYDEDPFIVNLNEDALNGTLVDLITSLDADSEVNSEVTYSLLNPNLPFSLVNDNEVVFNGDMEDIDYEGQVTTYIVNIRGENPPFFSDDQTNVVDVALVVNLVDRNDQPPVFPSRIDRVEINEHTSEGSVVYELNTTDADTSANAAVTYSILESDIPFALEGNMIVVQNSTVIDYDPPFNARSYMLTIRATNPPASPDDLTQTTDFMLSIVLNDTNDNFPVCSGRSSFMIRENSPINTGLVQLSAMDIDSGLNGNQGIMFFTEDNDMGDPVCSEEDLFSIDPDSGFISICLPFDYETTMSYDVNFTVCDGGRPMPLCTNCPVFISIIDVNDNAPFVNPPTFFTVSELAPPNTVVGCVNAEDADSGQNALLEYHLADTEEECSLDTPFAINEVSGCITLCQPLDHEDLQSYSFEVNVTDRGSPQLNNITTITIAIVNENDHSPVITSSDTASVIEEQEDVFVIQVTFEDIDLPPFNIPSFELLDDADGSFSINESTGEITTTFALDREEQETYDIVIQVSDGLNSGNSTLTVNLEDINDNAPEYLGESTFSFMEEFLFEEMLIFGDIDIGINADLTYLVDDDRFMVSSSGVLSNLERLDRDPETGGNPEIIVNVTARDVSPDPLQEVVTLTIVLVDVNDNSPVILETPIQANIIDGSLEGTVVQTVRGEDADEGSNALLRYLLTNPSDQFGINETTGVIFLIQDIFITSATAVREEVNITVSDSGVPARSATEIALFFIVSSLPVFTNDTFNFNISENSLGFAIGVVTAMDRDINPFNDVFIYSIISVTPYDAGFTIVSSGGTDGTLLTPAQYLDFEDATYFNITIGVSRVNMTEMINDMATVLITLENTNDNVPQLSPQNISASLVENAPVDTVVARAVAIDFDVGDSGAVSYSLTGGVGAQLFNFRGNGELVLRDASIDFENTSSYELIFEACDNGVPQRCSEPGYIFIAVLNLDDLPPVFFPSTISVEIPENFGAQRLVLVMNITDEDTPLQNLELSLIPPQSTFQITLISNMATITTTDVPVDRETQDLYEFQVLARDPSGSEGSATVTIRILDENDERPRIVPESGLVVEYLEEGPAVFPASNVSIVDGDILSTFPLTSVAVSLQQDTSSSQGYPNRGGVCDHANYSILYDSNSHQLCGQRDCIQLLREDDINLREGSTIENGILSLPNQLSTARNPNLFDGQDFERFSITIWVQFPAATRGNIFEVQGTDINVFEMFVDTDGSVTILIRTSSAAPPTELVSSGPLDTHDGAWHQISFIRDSSSLFLYFDCVEVGSAADNNDISTDFTSGSFFLGFGLQDSAFVAEFYFCSLIVVPQSHICCTLTCGEFLDVSGLLPNVTVNVDIRTRSMVFEYNGADPSASLEALEAALDTVTYHNLVNEPHPLDRGLSLLASDFMGPSDQASVVTLRPILINDQNPVLDLDGPMTSSIDFSTTSDETSTSSIILSDDAILYDGDSGFWPIVSVRVELTEVRGHSLQVLTDNVPPGITYNIMDNNRTLNIFSTDSTAGRYPDEFVDFLHQVRYINMQEEQQAFDVNIQFSVVDDALRSNDPLSMTVITVLPLNDPPELDLDAVNPNTRDSRVDFLESAGEVNILSGGEVTIVDPDSTQLSQATITFTLRVDGEDELLRLDPDLGIEVTSSNFTSLTGTLVIEYTADFNTWLSILGSVQYINNEENPNDNILRQVSIVVQDDGEAISEPVFVEITLVAANNPPELYLGGPGIRNFALNFTEDGPCLPLTAPDVEIRDPDSSGVRLIRITIGGANVNNAFESVETNATRLISIGNGILIILSSSSPEDYANVLASLVYCNAEDEPNEEGGRTVTFSVTDTGLTTASGRIISSMTSESSTFISIIRVNDRPVVTFTELDDISIRNTPTPIINSSTIDVDDSDDILFDVLRIYIINPQNDATNEIIEFSRQLPESSISRGPTILDGQFLYTVTFTGGAEEDRVVETISQLRYNNNADPDTIIVDPPRQICVDLSDFKIASELTCVNVAISPPNDNAPVFDPVTITSFDIVETDAPIIVTTLQATDDDAIANPNSREGQVEYSIDFVISTNRGFITVTTGIFSIDSVTGQLSAPDGLNAEMNTLHEITVLASDQGNPVQMARIVVTVNVLDINDEPPLFTGTLPYVADSQREELDPPNVVFIVTAVDQDITTANSQIVGYELLNFQDRFMIGQQNGVLQYYVTLDAEELETYVLNVSATDSGSPPLVSYTTVEFRLLDTNDNEAFVDQLTPAVYIINGGASSIGPAIRITDDDLDPPAISSISIVLTPNMDDLTRTYDQCLVQCQDSRLEQASLLPPAIDLLQLATFVRETETTIGDANCPAVTILRDDNRDDGYGEIQRGDLPSDFGAGEFSVSFVLTQVSEGFILLVPDQTDRTLPNTAVGREFGLWVRRRDFRFSYFTGVTSGEQRVTIPLTSASPLTEFFNPDAPQTRHFTVVVSTNPARATLYVDCIEVGSVNMIADSISTNQNINVFIGRAQPHPLNGGRLGGEIHGLYYHPTALSESQITDFCSCGFEALVLPSLPNTITAEVTPNQHSITLQGVSGLIPSTDAITVLRGVNYTNQFDSPTLGDPPTRAIDFTITEQNGEVGVRSGAVRLVSNDDNLPVIDLNGFLPPGIDTSTSFVENGGPVFISPDADLSRNIEGFTINPTFDNVVVQLTNARDEGEELSATASDVIAVVVSDNGHRLDIVGPGIPRDFNSVLQSVQYENLNNNPTISIPRTISYQVLDTEGRTNAEDAIATITLASVNDPPQLSLAADGISGMGVVLFEEGGLAVQVAPNISVIDQDDTELVRAEVTLTSPMLSLDALSINTNENLNSVYDGSTGVLTLSGSGTLSQYQSALSNVLFSSTDSPFLDIALDSLTRTVTIQTFDGEDQSGLVTVQVQFMPNNDAPIITLPNPVVTFRDGDNMILIAPTADISDTDNRQLESMTIELEGDIDDNILRSGELSSRVLVFDQGNVADYISILRAIVFVDLALEPALISRRITIEVCDFQLCSEETAITIDVQDVNDNTPTFSMATYQYSVMENSEIGTTIGSLSVSDGDIEETEITFSSDEPLFDLVPAGSLVHILTTELLDFEDASFYSFTVTASDGLNEGLTQVSIQILDVNEPPVLTFDPADPSLLIGPDSLNQLIQVDLQVSDPDVNDVTPIAQLTLRNVPQGSDESLVWVPVPDYTFTQDSTNEYLLTGPGDSTSLTAALRGVQYRAGQEVLEPTAIRTVAIVISNDGVSSSTEAVVTISLASIPQFSEEEYRISLDEETIVSNFLQVLATVETGGDTIEYVVEENDQVTINNITGDLSLIQAVDREDITSIILSVFAIDSLPPARTGNATVNITITDLNDVRPSIQNLDDITVVTGEQVAPFPNVQVIDPDITGAIQVATVSVLGDPLPSLLTGEVCVDEPNTISKMFLVCGGLEDGIVLLEQTLNGSALLTSDEHANDMLAFSSSGYATADADFGAFSGRINMFTFVFWVRAEQSGYVAYFGTADSVERYFAVFYSLPNNQLIVTVKREGVPGLGGQIRISFQLPTNLADGNYHFVMLQYSAGDLICVVDGQLSNSAAVVYKQQPFIGQVFSKLKH